MMDEPCKGDAGTPAMPRLQGPCIALTGLSLLMAPHSQGSRPGLRTADAPFGAYALAPGMLKTIPITLIYAPFRTGTIASKLQGNQFPPVSNNFEVMAPVT